MADAITDHQEKPRKSKKDRQKKVAVEEQPTNDLSGDKPAEDATVKLSQRDKMLLDLRMKLSEARKQNYHQVVEEDRREHGGKKAMGRERWQGELEKEKKIAEATAKGIDYEREAMLAMTVEESERLEKKSKQKEKHKAAFGWDVFNADTLYKAHRKKEKAMTIDMESYERQKAELGEKFYDPRDLTYGAVAAPPSENVDKLVEELNEQRKKRETFSRRRAFNEENDVDYINDRNYHFNKKLARAYDDYTQEIRENLERGTAL